jgi:hypothetical protein
MKRIAHYLLFIALALQGRAAFAQAGVLTGKVVDAANKPMWGAVVRVSKDGHMLTETRTSEDGIYTTKPFERGTYYVAVQIEGKELEAKKLFFDAGGVKKYYILKVVKDKVEINKMDEDAYNEMNLRERRDIQKRPKR